jgi:transposase
MSGGSSRRYPQELRERAVRMVAEISGQHDSEWAAISEVARLLGVGCAETVRKWVRQGQADVGARPGITTEESAELKRLQRENAELRRANAIQTGDGGKVLAIGLHGVRRGLASLAVVQKLGEPVREPISLGRIGIRVDRGRRVCGFGTVDHPSSLPTKLMDNQTYPSHAAEPLCDSDFPVTPTGEKCHSDKIGPTRRGDTLHSVDEPSNELEAFDIFAIVRDSNLSPEDRRHVHNALASGMLEGWHPTREAVALLIEAAAGNITTDEYKARVIASARSRSL